METIFYEDGRIQELLDLIVEKLFTVCLMTGKDADIEYAKGRNLIQKISYTLVESSVLTPDLAGSAILQLIEQRLPDKRIIENFPMFYSMMDRMIREGLDGIAQTPIEKRKLGINSGETGLVSPKPLMGLEDAIPVLAGLPASGYKNPAGEESDLESVRDDASPESQVENGENVNPRSSKNRDIPELNTYQAGHKETQASQLKKSSAKGVARTSVLPAEAVRLNYVLQQIFPKSSIRWNYSLAGTRFMAQVEDLLINVGDQLADKISVSLEKQGWRVVFCNHEDLAYPRRLERIIRNSLRKSKKSLNKD